MSFVRIQTITLGSTQSSITFSSIPQNFDHLVVIGNTRRDSASGTGSGLIQFNGDTNNTGNYYNIQMSSVGFFNGTLLNTQMYGTSSLTQNLEMFNVGNSTDTANSFPSNTIYIWNYKDSNFKKFANSHGAQFNTSGYNYQTMYAGRWNSTAPITSIRLAPTSGANLIAGSSVTLYGIALTGSGAIAS